MNEPFFAVVELMGHVRFAGLVSQEERFGVVLGRCDIPHGEGTLTKFFSGQSIYSITPCDEATALAVAEHAQPQPVHPYEMPRLPERRDDGLTGSGIDLRVRGKAREGDWFEDDEDEDDGDEDLPSF